jgi:hypothetical protein
MRKAFLLLFFLTGFAFGQGTPPITVTEVDGSPKITGVTKIIVSNGTLTKSGTKATITTTGGGTPGGSNGQVQYNNSSAFGGINTFTYDGNRMVFGANPLFNVGSTATDNLIYVNSTSAGAVNASFGFFVAGVGSQQSSDGPYFLARGNTFSNLSNQRGAMLFVAGAPSSPVSNEGTIQLYTGNPETLRLLIPTDGNMRLPGVLGANLGSPSDGTIQYCTNCNVATDPCTPGGTGAMAFRLNGRWYCP